MSHVLVIGASSVDVKGRAGRPLQAGTSVPGDITLSFGGVARNVAENLARLGQTAVLLSAVGSDPFGADILERTGGAGVDVSRIIVGADYHSSAYLAILDDHGAKAYAVDEMATVMNLITPAYIYANRTQFKDAVMLVLDANLSASATATAIRMAKRSGLPVAMDPTSATLAPNLEAHLEDLFMVTPNIAEAEVLCGHRIQGRSEALEAAQQLVGRGTQFVIVTLGEEGLCYATSQESGYVPAIRCDVIDLTGAGDALTAAVVFGWVHGFSAGEAARLGVSAATMTLKCSDTVCQDLSLERLYDQL